MPRMIAKTSLGSNLLGLGLFSHINALWIGMIPQSDTLAVFLYIAAIFLLIAGLMVEWDNPKNDTLFYTACGVSILPLIGPFIALKMAHSHSRQETETPSEKRWITSVFTLYIHPIVLLIWMIALMIISAFVS